MTDAAIPPAAPAPLERLLAGRPLILRALVALAASWLLAAGSWVEVPMALVPMTLQTYVLFVIAGLGGRRLTFEIVVLWLAQAAIGLPVLAGGASGIAALTGPTAGYLAGMLLAGPMTAGVVARYPAGWAMLAAFCQAHVVILLMGAAWLATSVGLNDAFSRGALPFLPGALVKSVAAMATVKLLLSVKAR